MNKKEISMSSALIILTIIVLILIIFVGGCIIIKKSKNYIKESETNLGKRIEILEKKMDSISNDRNVNNSINNIQN